MTNYQINILIDQDAENPLEAWGGVPMTSVIHDRTTKEYENDEGESISSVAQYLFDAECNRLSDAFFKKHPLSAQAFADCELSNDRASIVRSRAEKFVSNSWIGSIIEPHDDISLIDVIFMPYSLSFIFERMNESDKYSTFLEILEHCGYNVLGTTSTGYSQGDYAELYLASKTNSIKSLHGFTKLWESWAWGYVYGWCITEQSTDPDMPDEPRQTSDDDETLDDGTRVVHWGYGGYPRKEILDSSYGYYGDDGMQDALTSACESLRYMQKDDAT